ncbi:quinolinate synthase NadA [candidate division KSB1 bacterium]|nr:quinolinate synthase NadA [candidate division KSB1 bacterium]
MTVTADSVEKIYEIMVEKLSKFVPKVELRYKAELTFEINQLKKEKNAVILGHNYMEPALFHTVPDFTGDSLGLAREAAKTDKDIIVFCGVRFMAETAKILSPEKTVLLPSPKGGCSLAESITAEDVRKLREQYPGVPVVTYVNTYADVKAESDVCCTSGNAVEVVESFKDQTIIFLPDEFMAKNIALETGKHIIFPTNNPANLKKSGNGLDYRMIGWNGKCEVHEQFTVEDIVNVRKQFPDVVVLAHLECKPEVINASDYSGSTSGMIRYVEETKAPRYLLLTECSMGDNIAAANPKKEMLRLCSIRCPHMNEITLEQTRDALKLNRYVIDVPEDIRNRARAAVDRMIAIG